MQAILIDPFARTVSVVTLEGASSYEKIKAGVFGDGPQGYIEHVPVGAGHGLWLDEEGLLKPWKDQAFFALGAEPGRRTFAGRGVILRDGDDGESYPCRLPLALIASNVAFVAPEDVRVPTPTMTTLDDDGNAKVTRLADRDEWDFNNQPR